MLKNSIRLVIRFSTKKEKIISELKTNPKFDEAFPQLKKFKQPTTIKTEQNKEIPFFDTLTTYKNIDESKNLTSDQIDEINYKRFVEGFHSPQGPRKYMSEKDLLKINHEIDIKLQELENTGLSREEILSDGSQKGIPLSQDSFFQLIKNDYDARYVYLSPNEEYNPRRVIDLALRQDIGKDTFSGKVNIKEKQFIELISILQLERKNTYNDNYANTFTDLREHVNDLIRDNNIYHLPVKNKYDKKKENARILEDVDIHWRNVTFLSQFMNRSSKIKSRFLTFLNRSQQIKVSKQIKSAQQMLLLPTSTFLQEFHKKNLTSLQEDVEDFVRKYVNLENGQVYMSKSEQSGEKDQMISMGEFNLSEDNLKLVKGQIAADKLKRKELVKNGFDPNYLDEKKNEFKVIHTIQQIDGKMEFEFLKKEDEIKKELLDKLEEQDCQKEYDAIKNEVKDIPDPLFIDAIINENALKLDQVENNFIDILLKLKGMKKPKMNKRLSKEESLELINNIRKKGNLYEMRI